MVFDLHRELISICYVIIKLIHDNSRILVLLLHFGLNHYLLCFNFNIFDIILLSFRATVFVVTHEAYQQDGNDYDGSTQADQDKLSRFQAVIFVNYFCNRFRYWRNFNSCDWLLSWRCNDSIICDTSLIHRYSTDGADCCICIPSLEPYEFLLSAKSPPRDLHIGLNKLVLSSKRYRVNAIDIKDKASHS